MELIVYKYAGRGKYVEDFSAVGFELYLSGTVVVDGANRATVFRIPDDQEVIGIRVKNNYTAVWLRKKLRTEHD